MCSAYPRPPHSIALGKVIIPNNVWLAPLAGFTDRTFRALCRRFGCGLTFSEMVSAQSVVYNNAQSKQLLENDSESFTAQNRSPRLLPAPSGFGFAAYPGLLSVHAGGQSGQPFAAQFFGHDPLVLAEAIKRLEGWPFDIADINMGCPVSKVVRNGEGSALMNDPLLAGRMVAAAVRASDRPVTVKIRKGFTNARANAVEIARAAEASGAAAVTVHGRTREQFYAGQADWECIAAVKDALRIPVIGNGDVYDGESAAALLEKTRCDGVMVARGALGNPWVFEQILHYLKTGETLPPPEWPARAKTALTHLRGAVLRKGTRIGLLEMRKQLSFYVKGHPQASILRQKINKAADVKEMEMIISNDFLEPVQNLAVTDISSRFFARRGSGDDA